MGGEVGLQDGGPAHPIPGGSLEGNGIPPESERRVGVHMGHRKCGYALGTRYRTKSRSSLDGARRLKQKKELVTPPLGGGGGVL